jgi:dihydropyrimidinase
MKVHGVAEYTISRGVVVWEDNQLKTKQGHGKYIPRPCFGPVFDGIATRDKNRDEIQFKVEREPYKGEVIVLGK